ncbi:hypothetical protein [Pseudoalteromonas marina]|uniref:Uncharacterized protein n=1 Tax=Pseudoalteromonas marina TaxID=267375 RepID=A0ABT9FCD8_9GAMM|nr:hypothetical protein [Pseudoalteromonas marina]MDP2564452.1 hypothetical protein [Pseudoalteromonas marina]
MQKCDDFLIAGKFVISGYSAEDVAKKRRVVLKSRKLHALSWFMVKYPIFIVFGAFLVSGVSYLAELFVHNMVDSEPYFSYFEMFVANLLIGAVVCYFMCPIKGWFKGVSDSEFEVLLRLELAMMAYAMADEQEKKKVLEFCYEPLGKISEVD